MTLLAHQVCLNHPAREAVARCMECTRSFCRECIAEHDGRLVCAACLSRMSTGAEPAPRTWPRAARSWAGAALGLFFAWFCFYAIGRVLLTLPSDFHARKVWEATKNLANGD